MVKVAPNLYVGDALDVKTAEERGYSIISAGKEFHRRLLGYEGQSAPKDKDYLWAERPHHLYLNLVDSESPDYIPKELIEHAIQFITDQLNLGNKVLVHCSEGMSRGPSIALIWMQRFQLLPASGNAAMKKFRKIYPQYSPRGGMKGYIQRG